MEQVELPTPGEEPSHQRRFEEFHSANPHVYAALVRLARQWRSRGRKRLGIKQLFEVLRWEIAMTTESDDDFKLNNNLTSRYARRIMDREPDLADIFELRELKS